MMNCNNERHSVTEIGYKLTWRFHNTCIHNNTCVPINQWYRRTVRDETVSFLLKVFGVCLLSLCGGLCCCALWLCWLFVVYFACCAEIQSILRIYYVVCGLFDVIMAFFELSVNRCPSLWRFVRGGDAAGLQVLGSGSGVGKGIQSLSPYVRTWCVWCVCVLPWTSQWW